MKNEWKEILIESHRNGNLQKSTNIQESIETKPESTKFSQVDTIQPQKAKSKWFLVLLTTLFFLGFQLVLIYMKEDAQINDDKSKKIHESEKYIDLIDETLTSELEYIIRDARQYWKTISFTDTKDRWKVDKIFFFQNDKYLYYGVFKQLDNDVYSKFDYYNTEAFTNTNLQIDQFAEKLEGMEAQVNRAAKEGTPLLINLSDEKTSKEICIALVPVGNTIVLALGFYFQKWNDILSKREYGTYVLLNHQGIVLAHSSPGIAKNAPDYSEVRFFDFLKESSDYKTRKEFTSSSGKTVHVYIRKLLPIESYLIYLTEYEQTPFDWKEHYIYAYSSIIFIVYAMALIKLIKTNAAS